MDKSCTDAQLLLKAYESWGADLGTHLLGDFAIVFWDWRRRTLIVLRDQVGIKPLYYWVANRELAVATDIGVLIELVGPAPIPDDEFVVEHLLMEYRSSDRTFWSHLKRLPGGHRLEATGGGYRVTRYWQPPEGDIGPKSTAEVHEDLRGLFFQAVERRLDSDAPLLAHLSGGLDSSGIVTVADEIYKRTGPRPPLKLASALYPGLSCDESEFIRVIVERTRFQAESWDARADGLSTLSTPSLPGPALGGDRSGDMRLAMRSGVKTVLTGQGGDLLCGCEGVPEDTARARPVHQILARIIGPGIPLHLRAARVRSLARRLAPLPVRRTIGNVRGRRRAPPWLHEQWRGLAGSLAERGYPSERGARSYVNARHWDNVGLASLGLALDSDQQRAAASGIEVRHPFLDVRFIEYVLRIPFQHWPPVVPYARLHREFLADYLPEPIRRRPKATFSAGVAYRMKLVWPQIRSLLFEGEWHAARYVNRESAQALIATSERGADEDDWPLWRGIWGIAMLESWLRRVSEYSSPYRGATRQ